MFIGHFALAFGAKRFVPKISLGILFLACQLADIIWPNLVLLGFERVEVDPGNTVMTPLSFLHYPYSHSLVTTVIWSILFAAIYTFLTRSGKRAAIAIALLVLSHWALDFLTHAPDMPVTLNDLSPVGFGLWNIPYVAIPLELVMFAAGTWLYARHTKAVNRGGSIGFWMLVLFLLVVYVANLSGPPPPSSTAVAWSAQALWLLVAWGFWIDRNRVTNIEN